jgi:predicted dienelactone hydrolase
MLGSWPHHDALDRSRIGVFGFSAGGFTALVAIGGTPDITRVPAFCAVHPDDWACRMLKQRNVSLAAPPPVQPDWVHDPRIAAAVIAAPAVGYAFPTEGLSAVKVPMMLWRPDADEILPHPDYAQAVYDRLAVKPEYRVVANAGHFVFLTPCPPALAAAAPAICKDPAGFDRTSFHHTFNAAVVEFFKANLPAR